jgi:hypothetical protein
MDGCRDFGILCARFSLLYFKRRAGSPLSNDGWVLRLDLTSEICPPLQRSSCLYSDLTALVLSGILNGSNDQKCFSSFTGFRSFDQPELIFCLPGCVAFDHSIFLNISYVFLSVTNFLYLCYLPSMTSIRCLLNICQIAQLKRNLDQKEENQRLVFQEDNNETTIGVLESIEMDVDPLLFSKGVSIEEDEC